MCVLILSTTFVWNIPYLIIIQKGIIKNIKTSHVKYPLFLSDFNKTCFFDRFFQESLNIPPTAAKLFHTGRRTDGRAWRS
jgi:hypothetical protein